MTNNNRTSCGHGKVLLVDDEPDITTIMGICLEDNGIKADMFNDPLVALSYFKKDLYDLVILDIKMPKMNGLELYREIRKIDDKVKVCFLTANKSIYGTFLNVLSELKEKSEIQENQFIQKPIGNEELIKIINEIIS